MGWQIRARMAVEHEATSVWKTFKTIYGLQGIRGMVQAVAASRSKDERGGGGGCLVGARRTLTIPRLLVFGINRVC